MDGLAAENRDDFFGVGCFWLKKAPSLLKARSFDIL
jgi:hypothetical protein